MINNTGPNGESNFAAAHTGDLIQLTACTHLHPTPRPGTCRHGWRPAVRLVTEPTPCDDSCGCLLGIGVDTDGHTILVHASATRETRVIEHAPTSPKGYHA